MMMKSWAIIMIIVLIANICMICIWWLHDMSPFRWCDRLLLISCHLICCCCCCCHLMDQIWVALRMTHRSRLFIKSKIAWWVIIVDHLANGRRFKSNISQWWCTLRVCSPTSWRHRNIACLWWLINNLNNLAGIQWRIPDNCILECLIQLLLCLFDRRQWWSRRLRMRWCHNCLTTSS